MATEIQRTGNSLPSTSNSPALRMRVLTWVDRITDRRYPKTPTRDQLLAGATLEAVRAELSRLKEAQRPPTPVEWQNHYAMLKMTWPQIASQTSSDPQTAQKIATQRFQLFCSDLASIPQRAIAAACERYRLEPSPDGKQKFFPQTWQIKAMAEADAKESAAILRGIEEMERVLSSDGKPVALEEKPATSERMQEIISKLGVRSPTATNVHQCTSPAPRTPNLQLVKSQRPETPESLAELRETLARRMGEIP